MKNVVYRHK